jgi:hypothetical protein
MRVGSYNRTPLKPIDSTGRFLPVVVTAGLWKIASRSDTRRIVAGREGIGRRYAPKFFKVGQALRADRQQGTGTASRVKDASRRLRRLPCGQSLTRLPARRRVRGSRLRRNVRRFRLTRGTGSRGAGRRTTASPADFGAAERPEERGSARGSLWLRSRQSWKRYGQCQNQECPVFMCQDNRKPRSGSPSCISPCRRLAGTQGFPHWQASHGTVANS